MPLLCLLIKYIYAIIFVYGGILKLKRFLSIFLILTFAVSFLCACSANTDSYPSSRPDSVSWDGCYTSKEDVAEYIHLYNSLPDNFITKSEAKALGWDSSSGNLWDVAYGKSIGGDSFGNREGSLPKANGRKWYECDINYCGGYRGSERIVYSNDGLIYYTNDHYESFERLY